MFQYQCSDFSIREFSVKDYSELEKIASRINEKSETETGYYPFYAFNVSNDPKEEKKEHLSKLVTYFLQKAEREKMQQPRSTYRLAICDNKKQLIGNVTIDVLPVSEKDGRQVWGDLGYFIDPKHGGKGIMRKAVYHVLRTYFKDHDILDVTVHPDNIYSQNLLACFGVKEIKRLSHTGYHGEPRVIMQITKCDFLRAIPKLQLRRKGSIVNGGGRTYE